MSKLAMGQYETQNDVTYFWVEFLRVHGQWSANTRHSDLAGESLL
jgi:hypothetical protein